MKEGDLEYMDVCRIEAIESFSIFKLGGDALAKVIDFCWGLENQMTRESFMSNGTLYNINRKSLVWLVMVVLLVVCLTVCITISNLCLSFWLDRFVLA